MTQSFEEALVRFMPELKRYATVLARSDAAGNDLMQEAITKALKRKKECRGEHVDRWLIRLTKNLWNDQKRRESREKEYLADQALTAPTSVDPRIDVVVLKSAFRELTAENAELFLLVAGFQWTYAEAAEHFNIKKGTVMSRMSRIRAHLLKCLKDDSEVVHIEDFRARRKL